LFSSVCIARVCGYVFEIMNANLFRYGFLSKVPD